jgi:hypothetical protein
MEDKMESKLRISANRQADGDDGGLGQFAD